MDTELLKTFLEVSRTRHFGRAAESLYLTQSAVSFRIRQLENQLGVNLFTRHRNNIRLTAAGEKLLPYAETLMSTWQAARKEVAHTSRHNEFSIGASASLNRPGFPGECFICELRLPDHRFRWKHNKLFLLLPEEYGPAFPA
ncbi:LysR family transcriptional regulator, partial [Escherichia coli]|uniref:LysR family transcriptional regulator n=1 Tax=Escherichia coli TaxID=562 RepID=UPI0028832003